MLFLAWGSINIYLAVFNMFFGSETSDGKTFMEVIREEKNREYYNRLMIIYKFLKEGKKYSEMPEELFVIIEDLKDSQYCIKREMYMHRINYLMQNKGRT